MRNILAQHPVDHEVIAPFSLIRSLSLILFLSLSLFLSHTHALSLSVSLSHTYSLSHAKQPVDAVPRSASERRGNNAIFVYQ